MNNKQFLNSSKAPVVIITGPTASGKTAIALSLAKMLPIEIVSVDSALVYRGMDIGTAKPTIQERNFVPHHLIDIVSPTDIYSGAQFRIDAIECINKIISRKKIPVLVGGSMMYLKVLIDGITPLPGANAEIRKQIIEESKKKGWPFLHQQLTEIDPESASKIKVTDTQRLQRALEVYKITSKPLSVWHKEHNADKLSHNILTFAVMPKDRKELHNKIAHRFYGMLDNGFIDEVEKLFYQPRMHIELPSMRAVGYRQIWEYLSDRITKKQCIDKALAATRQLAKRQITWLRSWKNCKFIDNLDIDTCYTIANTIRNCLLG